MDDVKLVFSTERNSWNVFLNGEWYFESTDYESAEQVYFNLQIPEDEL